MKKYIFILIMLIIFLYPAFSDVSAVIKSFSGKVEIKTPGGNWLPVSTGMNLSGGTIISTGFGANMVLEVKNATITVKQLTRMELSKLIESQSNVTTNLYLNFGNIEADIEPSSEIQHDFVLKSPISTAAVRGTKFKFNGVILDVTRGTVELFNNTGQSREVGSGEGVDLSGEGGSLPPSSEDTHRDDFIVNPSTDDDNDDNGDDFGDTPTTTTVNIEVIWPE